MTHGGLEGISFYLVKIDFNFIFVYNQKTHTFFSVICGVSFFIPALCIVHVCLVLTSSIITSLENVLFLNHVYYTRHYNIVSYPLAALYGMIVTLLVSSVFLFLLFLLMGYLCLFLPHRLTNEFIISIFIF